MHRYIKAVGAGARRARALSRQEARVAMAEIVAGRAEPVQVGAFLLALRMKGETPEELAGFVDALSEGWPQLAAPPGALDVEVHGDGHAGRVTLLPAAACAAAALGVPVLLRAHLGSPFARHGLGAALEALGLHPALARDLGAASELLHRGGPAVLDLPAYAAPLTSLVELRPLFGLRTAAQTLMKLLRPIHTDARLVGVFHAPYLRATADALALLGDGPALAAQALGGLPEASPGKLLRIHRAGAAEPSTLDLRALTGEPSPTPERARPIAADPTEAAAQNLAALAGQEPAVTRAAAACALLLHAARGEDPLAAARSAHAALSDGRARAIPAALSRRQPLC